MMKLRVCYPHNFKRLLEYKEEDGAFHGLLGVYVEEGFAFAEKMIQAQLKNVSVEIQADDLGVGEYKEDQGHYDGCLGQLQFNQSEMMMQLSPYPLAIENVSQGLILLETGLNFASGYDKTELGGPIQLLNSLKAFRWSVWLLCMITCIAMSIFLTIEESFYQWFRKLIGARAKKSHGNIYQAMAQCFRRGRLHDRRITRRILFLCASLHSLLVVHYFNSDAKTELVVVKDPLIMESYDDIADRQIIPLFPKGMSYNLFFKSPEAEPFRRKLWQYAIESYGEDRLYVDLSPLSFMVIALGIISQKAVLLMGETLIQTLVSSGCSLAGRDVNKVKSILRFLQNPDELKNILKMSGIGNKEGSSVLAFAREHELDSGSIPEFLVHVSRDPREKEFSQGVLLSGNGNPQLINAMMKTTRRLVELGFALQKKATLDKISLFENHAIINSLLGKQLSSRQVLVEKCRSKSIVKPSVSLHSIKLEHMEDLFKLAGGIYLVLMMVLAGEIFWCNVQKHKPRGPKRQSRSAPGGREMTPDSLTSCGGKMHSLKNRRVSGGHIACQSSIVTSSFIEQTPHSSEQRVTLQTKKVQAKSSWRQ